MNILFNRRFVEPILGGQKIHTIRANYGFWARHDGDECSFRVWTGKPYRSPQQEFCRKVIHVQKCEVRFLNFKPGFGFYRNNGAWTHIPNCILAKNDGLSEAEFERWFKGYPIGEMACLHFTGFRY
jgi:hypothetical protein